MFGNALFVSRASGTAVASSKASPHRDLDVRKLVGGFRAKYGNPGIFVPEYGSLDQKLSGTMNISRISKFCGVK